jgi:hypothetical protein
MKYQSGDIVIANICNEQKIAYIISHRMWDEYDDYKVIICGYPNEYIWVLETHITEKIE